MRHYSHHDDTHHDDTQHKNALYNVTESLYWLSLYRV